MKYNHIFMVVGESSGDLHGGQLAVSLKKINPELTIEGICGPCMLAQGVSPFLSIKDFSVMGFSDVFFQFANIYKNYRKILHHILRTKPEAIILIDYQEFNLFLGSSLRKKGYKGQIIQYISPSVWAWRPKRANTLAQNCNLLLTIYPFEAEYYKNTSLRVDYIGNPVQEKIASYQRDASWQKKYGLSDAPIISIFPGSRKSELIKNLLLHLQAIEEVDESYQVCISYHDEDAKKYIENCIQNKQSKRIYYLISKEHTYELMQDSFVAIAKSGTVTLELALHEVPTVVTYQISKFHKFICKNCLKIDLPFYCIVNILGNKLIFPEYIDAIIDHAHLAGSINRLIHDEEQRWQIKESCKEVADLLKVDNPSMKAAEAIKEVCNL